MASQRDEILALAKHLFAEQGYPGTSMRDIADATGLLPGSLYTHFKSKAQLVQEIVVTFYQELIPAQEAVMELPGTGADRFGAMIEAVYGVCEHHLDELTILHYDQKEMSTLEEFVEVREISIATLDFWHDLMEQGIADGSIKATMDPELVMRMVTSSLHGILDTVRYRNRVRHDDIHPAEVLRQMILGGIATAGDPVAASTVPDRTTKAAKPPGTKTPATKTPATKTPAKAAKATTKRQTRATAR